MTILGRKIIVFAMLPEQGHHASTFHLAKTLQSRGHRVVYFGLADFEQIVKRQGFEFVPFATNLLPTGYAQQFYSALNDKNPRYTENWKKRWKQEHLFIKFLHYIVDGRLDDCLLACKPDLLICDAMMWYIALRGLFLKIPTMNISTSLFLYSNRFIPPITSGINPHQFGWNTLFISISWKWLRLKFCFTKRLASIVLGWYRFPTRMHHLVDVFQWIAKRSDYSCRENNSGKKYRSNFGFHRVYPIQAKPLK